MKPKFLLLAALGASLLTPTFTSKSNVAFAEGQENETLMDLNSIKALSHKDGMVVSFINDYMKEMWETDLSDLAKIKELYEYNTQIQSFANNLTDKDYIRNLYLMFDDFKPVNNTLKWRCNLNVSSFDIVVALNDELTDVVYKESGLKESSFLMENPYSGEHYFWQVTANKRDGSKIKSRVFDFYSENQSRTVDISGVSNTRDIGGVETSYGRFKQGLVYRSARLDDIDEAGLETFKKLNIQTDLDIRNDLEGEKNAAKVNNYYLRTIQPYFNAFADAERKNTVEAVRVFADPNNYPIDYHCTVGRDRTGTLTILLLGLFGASEDYIMHEYYNSLFSVTGAYGKELDDIGYNNLSQTIDALRARGSNLEEGIVNFLLEKEDPVTHEMVGLTSEEIDKIRKILSGEIEIPNKVIIENEDNYEGKCFVTFKCIGHKDVVKLIDKGSIVSAPYELSSDKVWLINKEPWDKNLEISESVVVYADYRTLFDVTIHFVGSNKIDVHKSSLEGEEISFGEYNLEGYSLTAITDQGKVVSKVKVDRDIVINVIYSKL